MSTNPGKWTWDSRYQDHYRVETARDGSRSYVWAKNLADPGSTPQPPGPPQPMDPYGARSTVPRTPFVPVTGGQVGPQPVLHPSVSRSSTAATAGRGVVIQSSSVPSNYSYMVSPQPSGPYGIQASPTAPGQRGQMPHSPGGPLPAQPPPREPYGAQATSGGGMYSRSPQDPGSLSQTDTYPGRAHPGVFQPNQNVARSPTTLAPNTNYTYASSNWMSTAPNPLYPTRSSSISIQPSSTNRSSGTSAVYKSSQNRPATGAQSEQQHVQLLQTQNPSASARAAGKQRSQEASIPSRSTTIPPYSSENRDEDDYNEDLQLSRAFSASRISSAQENKVGTSSRGLDSRGTTATSQSLPVARPTESVARPSGASSALDPKVFKHIRYHTERFFTVGRVFLMLHIENAGETRRSGGNYTVNSHYFTTVAHDEVAHHQFRRFVVVETRNAQHFCYCCPITTYNGRATTKSKVDQRAHSIVYMGKTPPTKLPGEKNMRKDPLRIVPTDEHDRLDPKSRIDFGRAYLIEHNVKVKDIGKIHEDSMPKLLDYRKLEKDRP